MKYPYVSEILFEERNSLKQWVQYYKNFIDKFGQDENVQIHLDKHIKELEEVEEVIRVWQLQQNN